MQPTKLGKWSKVATAGAGAAAGDIKEESYSMSASGDDMIVIEGSNVSSKTVVENKIITSGKVSHIG